MPAQRHGSGDDSDQGFDPQRADDSAVCGATNLDRMGGLGRERLWQIEIEGMAAVPDAGGLQIGAVCLGARHCHHGAIHDDVEADRPIRMGEVLRPARDTHAVAKVEMAEQRTEPRGYDRQASADSKAPAYRLQSVPVFDARGAIDRRDRPR